MSIETYKGIKVPTDASDSINSGTTTVGGILIDNDKILADRVTSIESRGLTNWKHGDAEPDATLNPREGDAYFRSTGMTYVYTSGAWVPFVDLKGPPGSMGTPTINASSITGGNRVTLTSGSSSVSIDVMNGTSCSISTTEVTGGHKLTVTNGSSSNEFTVYDGTDGITPTITSTSVTGGHKLTITNGSSSSEFTVYDGTDGTTPTITSTSVTGGHKLTITNGNSSNEFTVYDGTDGYTPTITLGTKVNGSQTLTVTNKTGSTTTTINDGVTGWNEAVLTDSTTTTLSDGDSVYSSLSMSAVTITTSSGWTVGHTARVGVTFASSSTFSYPSTWIAIGDDCSGGDFTFSQGSSYWLNMECKPDGTWMTVVKVPS